MEIVKKKIPADWEKMFTNHMSDKRFTSEIYYRTHLQLNNKNEK